MTSIVRSDMLQCERIVRAHARTFLLASLFLPAPKRRAVFAVYAFCRTTDEIVDGPGGTDRKAAARLLQYHRRDLVEALEGRPRGPVFRELRWAVREYNLSATLLFDLVAGVARDLEPAAYETWEDLERYCIAVASTVGIMCTRIFGVRSGSDQKKAIAHARTLGVAMQLTNILRDVGEDARAGRCYLPWDELARFGVRREEVFDNPALPRDPRWQRLMSFQTARARSLYQQSLPGLTMLSEDSQRCAAACAIGYAAILDALEDIHYDSVSTRAAVAPLARLGVLWSAWRFKDRVRFSA